MNITYLKLYCHYEEDILYTTDNKITFVPRGYRSKRYDKIVSALTTLRGGHFPAVLKKRNDDSVTAVLQTQGYTFVCEQEDPTEYSIHSMEKTKQYQP